MEGKDKRPDDLAIKDNAEEKSPVNLQVELVELRDEIGILRDRVEELESHHITETSYLNRPPERK